MPTWVRASLPFEEPEIEITCTRLTPGDRIEVRLHEGGMMGQVVFEAVLNSVDPVQRAVQNNYVIREEPESPFDS